jgi:cytidylate kinase
MSQPPDLMDTGVPPADEAPRHGFQGDRGAAPACLPVPQGLSIAVSREAGARGGTIARRVAAALGWQLYDQDLLEYMAQDTVVRQGVLEGLAPAAASWVEARLSQLCSEGHLAPAERPVAASAKNPVATEGSRGMRSEHRLDAEVENLARLVLALAAQGEVVLIGRGAGCILPRQTTLCVRIVAPLAERIAYMAQWLRLPLAEATQKVRSRDERRAEFLLTHFHRSVADLHGYDMVLDSGSLGEDGCAELVARAAHIRWTAVLESSRP